MSGSIDGNGNLTLDVAFTDDYAGLMGTGGAGLPLDITVTANLSSSDAVDQFGNQVTIYAVAQCTGNSVSGTPAAGTVQIVCVPAPELATVQGTWYLQSIHWFDRLYNSGGPSWGEFDAPVTGSYAFGTPSIN